MAQATPLSLREYRITKPALVERLLPQVKEREIFGAITKLSSYKNRFYTSPSGVKAALDLAKTWSATMSSREDSSILLFKHKSFPQPSVWLTIKGRSLKGRGQRHIVLGAHIDSINELDYGPLGIAPGAGDNASGVAVISEALRVMIANGYRPNHTIHFIAYAGEEAGMLGSLEIAEEFHKNEDSIMAVINFDGANFKGSKDIDIALLRDFTDPALNRFLGKLIQRYLRVPWEYDQCGRICSDNFSWHNRGIPVAFPFESRIRDENPYIHTDKDTLRISKNRADHATLFAKLAIAFVVEMDK